MNLYEVTYLYKGSSYTTPFRMDTEEMPKKQVPLFATARALALVPLSEGAEFAKLEKVE